MSKFLLMIVFGLSLSLQCSAEPKLRFESRNHADQFQLRGDSLIIRSRRGIGTVTVSSTKKNWPPLRTLRFEYADGKGMKVLEGLQINTGNPHQRSDYFDTLKKRLKNGALEVELPPELPNSTRSLRIHWVDFYR